MDPDDVQLAKDGGGDADGTTLALFRRLVEHSPAVVYCCAVAPDLPVKYVSGAVKGLLGHEPADFLGATGFWRGHLHPDDRERISDALDVLLDVGHLACEYRFRTRSGDWRWLRDEANVVHDARGRPVELIGCWTGIDTRKRAETQLRDFDLTLEEPVRERSEELPRINDALHRAAEEQRRLTELTAERRIELERAARTQQLGELAAGLAHEINQPLAALIYTLTGAARRADRGTLSNAQTEVALRGAIAHAHRAAEIVAHVRSATSRHRPQRVWLRIGEVIAEMIAVSRRAADAAGVRLVTEIGDDVPPLLADRVQMEQMLLNLIKNGIEAVAASARRRRSVVVEAVRADASRVDIAVEDSGDGLAPSTRARIFEPFYTTKEHGMGLGLAICQTIVDEHGGAIRAEPAMGGGLRVVVSLPAGEA